MKIGKKLLSVVLAACMVLTLLPATALAAPASVASAAELAAALAEAANGDTITLSGNISGNFSYIGGVGKTVTIDGGGASITGVSQANAPTLTLEGGGTVILKNITLQGGPGESSCGLTVSGGTNVYGDADVAGGNAIETSMGLLCINNDNATVTIDSALGGNVWGPYGASYGLRSVSVGTVAVTTATGGSVYGDGGASYGIANTVANVYAGSATGGSVNRINGGSYGVSNSDIGSVSVGLAQGGSSYNSSDSFGVYNYGSGTVNASQAVGGSSQYSGTSYSVKNFTTGTVNAGTTTGNIDTAADATTNTGSATATLTLNKGAGASCVLDSITVAGLGTTSVGVLPPVTKNGVEGTWFTTDALTPGSEFTGSSVSGTTALYSSFYVKPAETSTDTYVLINGVKWATRNVAAPGTFAASPEAASMFYQWNSKVGWSSADPLTASDGSSTWDSTWNGGFDSPSGSDTWIAANDPSPAGYRVPTMAELQTLEDSEHVTKTWTSLNGVQVWRFTDKTTNQFIYLPALGFRRDSTGELATVNTHGIYWSSTAYDGFALAWNTGGPGGSSRANGFLVRPVLAADFAASTDSSTANDTATLGLVGTSVVSSAAGIATAAISDGHIAITSVSAGAATITVTDGASHSATIGVTVNHDGSVTLGTITKYVLAAPGNPVWDDATSSHIAKWDAVADAAVYRVVFYNGNKQIGDVIETGTVTQYDFTSAITAAGYGSFTFEVQVKVNSGAFSRWSDRSAVLPLFSPVTSVEVSPTTATVQKGATQQFTATVNATAGTAQTVTWELVGNTSANTSVSADGLLTVGADETGTILNVTAVSTVDISKSSTAAVVVPSVETLVNTLSSFGLTADVSGNTVTVTGTKVATDTLVLTIPTGVKVLWNASLTGAADAPLILLNGAGIFELAGGEIVNTGTGGALSSWDTSLVISDGTASSSSDFATVMTYYRSENPPTITMTGGNVISTSEKLSSCAISAGGNTVITGGTVTAQDGNQVVLSNAVVVYRSGLLTKINSGSLSASIAVSPSKTYATPTETDGLTATGYSATTGNVTAKWAVLYPGEGTGVWVDYTYSGTGSGTWRVSYPAVQVVSGKHLLTYNSNGGEGATPFSIVYKGQSYTVGNNVFTRTNYTFTGWNTEADGTGTPYAAGATLIGGPGSEDILLFAQWLYTGSGKTGDSSGGGAVTTPSTSKPTTSGDMTSVTTEVKPTTSGTTASATVSKETMTSAIDAAMDAAEKSKTTANVTLAVAAAKDVTAISATVPVASVNKLSDAKADGSLTLQTPLGSVTLDNSALTSIADKAVGSEVSVSIAKVDSKSLTTAQQALVGDRPVIDLTVTSGGKNISNLRGIATVSVPYTPAVGEDTSHLVVWYLADNGSLTPMDCSYSNGKLTFSTTHFSKYVVAQFPFSDVKGGDWFYTSVAAMQAKGLMNGVSSDSFAPQATTTRGMIVTMLHRLANQPETTANVSFSDTESSAYYFNAVKWANDKGIVKGVSDDEFAPNGSATREQLVTILYRYAGSPAVSTPTDMSKFSDADKISDFAAQPFAWAIQKGIISGNTDGTLNPTGTATRAEIATMFNNYISVK